MKLTKLKDHEIIKVVSEICRDHALKRDSSEDETKATRQESYAIETFLSLSDIVICLDQLHFSVKLLSGYRDQFTPEKMNRYDYIVFGIENFYLRLTSVFDRCLRLSNIVFQLGLQEKDCNRSTVVRNAHVKSTAVAKALKNLDDFTGSFRFYRNTVAHESTYSERELEKIGSYYYVGEIDDEFKSFYPVYKRHTDEYVAKKQSEFQKHISELENHVELFLDGLSETLKARIKVFALLEAS